ncbi:MAG TPA: CsbD family protein [Gemmatimonadales bacterium]|nr:CsbD family protein [Gemmatimonadales bacterium]
MNNDRLKGDWKRMKGKIREKWGELTDDDVDIVDGRREQLAGLLQKRYGMAKDEVEKQPSVVRRIHSQAGRCGVWRAAKA